MNRQRKEKYKELEERIKDTPLEKFEGEVPNGNNIWIKNVAESPFGSHYDLPYLKLFQHYEEQGKINPGDKVFDSTSGSAGISMTNIGNELGYECHVAIPDGGEQARVDAIKNAGAEVYLTPAEDYVNGFLSFNKRFLSKNRDIFFLNHSMGKAKDLVNEVTLGAFENIMDESLRDIRKQGENLDYFVPAVGNGSSILGPGRVLDKNKTKTLGFEPFQAALAYDLIYPGKYKELYGIEPGSLPRGILPGMSFSKNGKHVPIPHIEYAVNQGVLDDVMLVSDWQMDKNYKELTGKELDPSIPRWDNLKYNNFGRSTRAGLAVSKDLAEETENKNFLVIGYDYMTRYDDQT